jgi:hypothetical protein
VIFILIVGKDYQQETMTRDRGLLLLLGYSLLGPMKAKVFRAQRDRGKETTRNIRF